MTVGNTSRSFWILLLSIVVIVLLFFGATVGALGKSPVVADELIAPILYDIDNADSDGNYVVEWSAVSGADEYIVREGFNNEELWDLAYRGTNLSLVRADMPEGQYCYRVRGIILDGEWGPWSEVKCTVVGSGPPKPTATGTPTATAYSNAYQYQYARSYFIINTSTLPNGIAQTIRQPANHCFSATTNGDADFYSTSDGDKYSDTNKHAFTNPDSCSSIRRSERSLGRPWFYPLR